MIMQVKHWSALHIRRACWMEFMIINIISFIKGDGWVSWPTQAVLFLDLLRHLSVCGRKNSDHCTGYSYTLILLCGKHNERESWIVLGSNFLKTCVEEEEGRLFKESGGGRTLKRKNKRYQEGIWFSFCKAMSNTHPFLLSSWLLHLYIYNS